MTKDEALQMCLEYIETDAHERKYVRHAIKAALEANEFNPDWDTQAVLVEEIQRMAKRIEELEAKDEPVAWEGGEDWESLAWQLCADECGEEACTELIWEGGPIPEPWGDRWMKYEYEAKRLIALVRKHTTQPQRTWVGLTDAEANQLWESTDSDWELMKRTEAKLKEKNT